MTVTQFDNGYWYADELKAFAKELGVRSASKLRKDELEEIITHYLRNGELRQPARKNLAPTELKDVELGLRADLPVIRYTNDKETKAFLEQEALNIDPSFRRKSGARYRLNRWREEQIEAGKSITYGEVAQQYVKLCQVEGSFPQVPTGRYINFISDFLAGEDKATREQAMQAWKELKKLDIPKNYQAWKRYRRHNDV